MRLTWNFTFWCQANCSQSIWEIEEPSLVQYGNCVLDRTKTIKAYRTSSRHFFYSKYFVEMSWSAEATEKLINHNEDVEEMELKIVTEMAVEDADEDSDDNTTYLPVDQEDSQSKTDLKNMTNSFYIILNIFSAVGIVTANKWVFQIAEFTFGTVLTIIHFIVTFIGLEICARMGVFERKHIPLFEIIGLCLSFCAFVVLSNLSLQHNSIGFYQIIKVLTIPCVVLIQIVFYKISFSRFVLASLAITCIGVPVSGSADVQFNVFGCIIALMGVLTNSVYQVWIGTRQKELGANPYQLLYYQAPISAVILLFFAPFVDDFDQLHEYQWSVSRVCYICISALLAFLVNISTFLVIGHTSTITYNVASHFKIVLVLITGFVVFHDPIIPQNILGIVVTLFGVVSYSYCKRNSL